MKKLLIISIAFLSAQQTSFAKIRLGLQAGASVSQPSINVFPDAKSLVFLQPGLVTDFKLFSGLNFKPSLNYLRSGFGVSTTSGSVTTDQAAKINNINIPLNFTVPITLGPGKLLITAGPSINYAFSGNSVSTITTSGIAAPSTLSPLDFSTTGISRINWGSNFGLGYQLKNGFELNANYTLGLKNLDNTGITDFKNNTIALLASYYFIK